jgi:hypothetical protein
VSVRRSCSTGRARRARARRARRLQGGFRAGPAVSPRGPLTRTRERLVVVVVQLCSAPSRYHPRGSTKALGTPRARSAPGERGARPRARRERGRPREAPKGDRRGGVRTHRAGRRCKLLRIFGRERPAYDVRARG